jgi:hypothetical protein
LVGDDPFKIKESLPYLLGDLAEDFSILPLLRKAGPDKKYL